MYGLHTIAHRYHLWAALKELKEQMNMPWLIMGDFNAMMDMDDRVNGTIVQDNEVKDLRDFMEDCKITELPTVGRPYTWTNSHVYSRIDRAILNAEWMIDMLHIQVQVMDPHFSDHSPLSIEVEITMDNKKKPFKFYNCLAEYPNFAQLVQEGWQNRSVDMKGIWYNLKIVKATLKGLNRKEFADITTHVKTMRDELATIQAAMRNTTTNVDVFEAEKAIRQKLEKWSMIEKSIFKKRSRVQWLKLGDSNTTFFFCQHERENLTKSNQAPHS
ncbi:uncharacterized protein [Nicotiana tomentosiformis]|uniref:uncharacterized protein n=1 Tax=Nicotiana tomentosiformis TaxID=4098 RepID=UPI00051C3B27|nr:uncharacterized protein LOC104089355 [Nicotiana tomentosiformis]